MQVIIAGTPKEIAVLALELQGGRELDNVAEDIIRLLQEKRGQSEQVFRL